MTNKRFTFGFLVVVFFKLMKDWIIMNVKCPDVGFIYSPSPSWIAGLVNINKHHPEVWCLFYRHDWAHESGWKLSLIISTNLFETGNIRSNVMSKVEVEGGGVEGVAALTTMQLNDPDNNWEMYSNWSESVSSFPKVIKQKVRGNFQSLSIMLDSLFIKEYKPPISLQCDSLISCFLSCSRCGSWWRRRRVPGWRGSTSAEPQSSISPRGTPATARPVATTASLSWKETNANASVSLEHWGWPVSRELRGTGSRVGGSHPTDMVLTFLSLFVSGWGSTNKHTKMNSSKSKINFSTQVKVSNQLF